MKKAAALAGLSAALAADVFLESKVLVEDDWQDVIPELDPNVTLPVFQVDMYRAMQSSAVDTFTEENDNLADLGGVLKYLHTEVTPEYCNSQNRWQRKYDIDTVAKQRFKVRNQPMSVGQVCSAQNVDFGPFTTYDQGQSTNPQLDPAFKSEVGDWVGIQGATDPAFGSGKQHPLFWFSIGGFCPNLPWTQLPRPDGGTTARCSGPEKYCNPKGQTDSPNAACWKNNGDTLMGGLCEDGVDANNTVPSVDPQGKKGCVYTYGKASTVDLDELVGIKDMDCGNRTCENWIDFRAHCTDKSLQRMYKIGSKGTIIDLKNLSDGKPMCIEYDAHPTCQHDCSDPMCQKSSDYEIAIPFWRNRCDPAANERRAEILALALGIKGATTTHQVVAEDIRKLDVTCSDKSCQPSIIDGASHGGPYCSRDFSSVCYNCHVRGVDPRQTPGYQLWPDCPFGILQGTDYGPSAQPGYPQPKCKTRSAGDSCCLYMGDGGCDGSNDPDQATLDIDGLAMIGYRCYKEGTSSHMVKFAQRVATDLGGSLGSGGDIEDWAYSHWGVAPMYQNSDPSDPHKSFADFQSSVKDVMSTTPTPTPSPSPSPSPSTSPKPSGGGGGNAGLIIGVVIAVLVVLGGGAAAFFFMRNRQGNQDAYQRG